MPETELPKPHLPVIPLILLALVVLSGVALFASFAKRTPVVVTPAVEVAP